MNTIDIALWSTSLTLAVAGIFFGVIASINSSRANNQIKELVRDQMVSEESNKYFFTNLSELKKTNKKVLKDISAEDLKIQYNEYADLSIGTRFAPIPTRVEKYLMQTEFKDLLEHYVDAKTRLDQIFKEMFEGNFEQLVEQKQVTKSVIKKLIKYHEQVAIESGSIIREYISLNKSLN